MRTTVAFVAAVVTAAFVATSGGPAFAATAGSSALAQDEGTVVGRPNIELSATENRLGAGEQAVLDVFVSNSGDLDRGGPAQYEQRVTTARNVRLEIDETRMDDRLARNIEVETGTVFAGTVPEGVSGPFGFNVEISDSIAPGTYEIPVRVEYDYTNFVRYGPNAAPEYGDSTRTTTAYLTIVVEDRPRFEIRTQNLTRVTAGDTTTYRLNVTNTGTQPATNAQVRLSAANSSVFFGGANDRRQRTSVFFDRLEPGQTRTFEITVGASADTAPGTYLADAVVAYENPNGVTGQSKRLTFGVAVGTEQTFAVRQVDSSLRVGDTGLVTGRVVNTGETEISNAVVLLQTNGSNFRPRATEFAIGDLAPGESTNFSFTVETGNDTEPGPRRVSFRVRYRNPSGDTRTSDAIDARVAVAREQTFGLRATAAGLSVGERGTISGTVVNTGTRNASDAVVVLRTEGTNFEPKTTEFAVGDLAPGESAQFDFEASVPNESDPGVRQVSFRIRYRNADDEIRFSDSLDASVRVGGERTFAARSVVSDLQVGDSGTVSGTITNTGETSVSNAVVVFGTDATNLRPRSAEFALGTLEPGEEVPFEYTVDVPNSSDAGPRQVSFRVRYRNRDGDPRVSSPLDARVQVGEEQAFSVGNVRGDLRVGDTGDLAGEVVNAGNRTVSNAVVVLRTNNPNLDPRETEFAVGQLQPGESASFEFTVDVNGEAEAGPRQVSFRVRYRNQNDDLRISDTVDARVTIAEERDEFRVEPVNATVSSGGSEVVAFRVTNTANQTLRDVEAKLFASDPLSSDNDEAFVSRLEPNESAILRFAVASAGGAIPKTYPVSVDFTYENQRGDTVLSDTYRVPVEVTERERRGLPLPADLPLTGLVVGGAALVALVLAWWKREAIAGLLP
ncbi:CARDB domain-containing protein [Halorussus lipolyticus]|uniref:CARDB domain-containing protein n=1 Tax=Halorussus lipolyticus TaxID=3034024 RepID=UPI0023E8589B|nr:CARDB domain-containing protein [Halorussus sp. DT80]